MKIFKYKLNTEAETTIVMPVGAKILSVQNQRGEMCLWCIVGSSVSDEIRRFYVACTGFDLPPEIAKWKFIGTVQFHGGDLVLHVFSEKE